MGWHEFHERRDALDRVLAEEDISVPAGFADLDEVLLALHHRWSLRLASRVELAAHEADRDGGDPVDAVAEAWREAAEENPALRRVLDAHADRPALREVTAAQDRMLASAADLADPTDGAAELAAVGAAFRTLVRNGPTRTGRRPPVERLLRRLVPSA